MRHHAGVSRAVRSRPTRSEGRPPGCAILISMRLDVILQKDEDGYYVASCPAIKGCHTQGKTKREALSNIREAIIGCLEVLNAQAKKAGRRHHAELARIAV